MNTQRDRLRSVFALLALVAVFGATAFHSGTRAQDEPKRTIFYTHGRIYTNDPENPWAEGGVVFLFH